MKKKLFKLLLKSLEEAVEIRKGLRKASRRTKVKAAFSPHRIDEDSATGAEGETL
jgi:hypothetical protein